jgi:Acetyltransferase (GNAT) family
VRLRPFREHSRTLGQATRHSQAATVRVVVTEKAIEIREFREGDLETVVEFSLRAWAPVFASVRDVLGEDIFLRLHPNWKANQAEAVRSSCTNDERDVFVAVDGGRPVGFVAIALNAFHERMGVIDIIGVDPDYQRRGIDRRRPWPHTRAGGIRNRRVHAPAYRTLLPATGLISARLRVTFPNTRVSHDDVAGSSDIPAYSCRPGWCWKASPAQRARRHPTDGETANPLAW